MNMRPNAAANDDLRRMVCQQGVQCSLQLTPAPQELVANSSMSIADGDVLMSAVRRHQVWVSSRSLPYCFLTSPPRQRWTLMPYALLCGCLTPTALMRCVHGL